MSDFIFNLKTLFDGDHLTQLSCLQQHGCEAFYIPAYQRGYKWGSDPGQQVDRLLKDLEAALKNKRKEYLLQAITVKKAQNPAAPGSVLEVIDGQQRLTTLTILFTVMANSDEIGKSRPNPSAKKLYYAIRGEKQPLDETIRNLLQRKELKPEKENRQDVFYQQAAVVRCREFATETLRSEQMREDFFRYLCERVKLLVNLVESHVPAEEAFGNLNSNRVELTETELIKGLLLTRSARPLENVPQMPQRALQDRVLRGRKWDEISGWIQREEVKGFFFGSDPNPMLALLQVVALRSGFPPVKSNKNSTAEVNPLFEWFNTHHQSSAILQKLAETFALLQEWYEDPETYNLIGFILNPKDRTNRITALDRWASFPQRSELRKDLLKRRNKMLGNYPNNGKNENSEINLDEIGYDSVKENAQIVLLALSVFKEKSEKTTKFNFHAYRREKWSLEHIFPQNPFGKNAELTDEQRSEAKEILFTEESPDENIIAENRCEFEKLASQNLPEEEELAEKIGSILKENPLINRIGNLCLLTSNDNSALGCKMFRPKREAIRKKVRDGSFVPSHTYAIFSKMIPDCKDTLGSWTSEDIKAHEKYIKERIEALLQEGREV